MQAHLWLWLARWAVTRGLFSVAESCYRHAGARHDTAGAEVAVLLGKGLIAAGRLDEAVVGLRKAALKYPAFPRVWCALGAACRHAANMPGARAAYERALELDPGYLDALTNLGEWHLVSGDPLMALKFFEDVLGREARHLEALTNRVAALIELGDSGAEASALDALKLFPDSAPLYVNLGQAYEQMSRGREAAASYKKALEIDPDSEEAALSLATLLGTADLLGRAVEFIRKQITVRGDSPDRLGRLALALTAHKSYAEGRQVCERILEKHPDHILALTTLGGILDTIGEPLKAIDIFERVVTLRPDLSSIHSNVLFEMHYLAKAGRDEIFRRHLEWAARHEAPLLDRCSAERQQVGEVEERKIRVGYLSGDFVSHPVGFLVRDILRDHDRERFEVYCYSLVTATDMVTEQIRSSADHWREAYFLSDDVLAKLIIGDRIDILVDLSGHTANNRLKVFAMRPAPVQVSWIGYFHSTGLSSIDYFITDPYSTPPGSGQLFSEMPVYLPHTRFCYSPPDYACSVTDAPSRSVGRVTFGSFNRLGKLTDDVISNWVRIVNAVPGSRLVIKTRGLNDADICSGIRTRFESAGLHADRLELRSTSSHQEMFRQYGEIDISLDPFPFNGGMTTLEALWMGVPVVALTGDTIVSRQSTSALTNIGLTELCFPDVDSYVAGAIALANDSERLQDLRRQIRSRLSRSPICQPEQFTADLEVLYRRMWQAWLKGEKLGPEIVPAPPISKKAVLHVGCGGADRRSLPQLFQSGWNEIRLDIDPSAMPDVVASMLDMSPVAAASVDAVFSSHNIEHLHPHEVDVALREFRRVLKSDGMVVLTCPDLQSVCALVADDKLEETAYVSPAGPIAPLDILYGLRSAMAAGNLYMAHKTGFTAKSLDRALRESGFQTVVVERGPFFDLWALAYPGEAPAERVAADKTRCFPLQPVVHAD